MSAYGIAGLTRCTACRRVCVCRVECVCGWLDGESGDFYCNDHDEAVTR